MGDTSQCETEERQRESGWNGEESISVLIGGLLSYLPFLY
jgi:hypothetical protein